MKQLVMFLLTIFSFVFYKNISGNSFDYEFGLFFKALFLLLLLISLLSLARLGEGIDFLLQGMLFSIFDAVWRVFLYFKNQVDIDLIVILNDAPVAYFLVIYFIQSLIFIGFLWALRILPFRIDFYLIIPMWLKQKFDSIS